MKKGSESVILKCWALEPLPRLGQQSHQGDIVHVNQQDQRKLLEISRKEQAGNSVSSGTVSNPVMEKFPQ